MQIRLLVGAPRATDFILGSGVKTVGAVYKCAIKGSCTKLKFNYRGKCGLFLNGSFLIVIYFIKSLPDLTGYNYELNSTLLGSVIDVASGRYLVCAFTL
jgi:hypothetical protein